MPGSEKVRDTKRLAPGISCSCYSGQLNCLASDIVP